MVVSSLFTRLLRAILLNETVFNSDDLLVYCFLKENSLYLRHWLTKLRRSSYVQGTINYYCEKPLCMRCTVTQFVRESVGLCPFRGSYLREFELSQSNLVSRIIVITHTHNLHVNMLDFGPFYRRNIFLLISCYSTQ